MLTAEQSEQWDRDGFFVVRGLAAPDVGHAMEAEIVDAIRRDPPARHPGQPAYTTEEGLIIKPETSLSGEGEMPDEVIAKVFNPHLSGAAHAFALSDAVADVVAGLLGPDIDVFQSQFIFKNPRAWGQPWHQDSYYFPFKKQPQVGVWLAISEATLENGCLSVLPGSHKEQKIHPHDPDSRDNVNQGYLEVRGADGERAVPVLMQPGDVLFFHSYLLHRSENNRARSRRSAMVYHYGRPDSGEAVPLSAVQKQVLRWTPVRRAA